MSSFEVPVGPAPGPEDDITLRLREMQIERLRSSVASAQQQDPNRAAQALRLGLPANAPQQVIDRLMQDQARVNTEREIMQQRIAPAFWGDVNFAAIASDDPYIHKAEGFWDITGQAARFGAGKIALNAARAAENLTKAMQYGSAAVTAGMLKQPGEQITIPRPSPTWVTDLRETIEESTRSWVPASGTFARDVYSSTVSSVGQAVLLGLTLGPAGILAGFGMIGFGEGQAEAKEAGKGELEAALYGAATGSIETILSSFPVLGAFGRAAAGKGLGRNIIRTAIEEAITETATEGSQGLMRWKWLQADRSWEQVWPELSYSMQVAAAAGAFGAAATTPVFHFMQSKVDAQDQRVSQAEARGRSVNGVSDVAQQSPAVQRAPEVVGPFIDAVHEQADVNEYRIDSAKFAELVDQAGGVDVVRALVPDAVDQLLTNKGEEGTEIVLKPGEYQTTIGADAKLAALFNEHLRVGDADLSMAEAREVQATADEMVDELAKQAEEELQRKQQVSKEEGEIAEEIVAAVLGPEPTATTPPLEGLQESLAENAEAAAQQAEQIEQQQAEITPEQQQLQEQQAVADQTAAELGEVPAPDVLPTTVQEVADQAADLLTEVARQAGIDVGVVEEAAPAPQQPALPPAEVEFRQWFGRSEAVDRAGEPLVLAPATLAKSDQAPGVTAFVEVPASESGVAVSLQKPMQVTGKQAQEFITNPKAREKALQKAKDRGFDGVVVTAKTKDENKRFIRQTFYVPVDQSQVRDFATPPRTAEPEVLEAPGQRAPGQIPPGTPQPKVTRDQIRGQAKLYSAMVARLAADFEMSPKEFWQAHGPRIVSASVGVLTSEQQAAVANTTGAYVPKNLEVILTTEQTEDTLIHELSHHYLHSLIELVRAGAPDGVNTKLDNLFGFLGVDSVATWDSLPVDQKVKLHEKFAYSFTEYLATGKAPSNKLRDLFASLKQWITGFYTDVRAKLDADYFAKYNEHLPVLTPQVTAVFDSLLASDLAIERAKAADLSAPLYQTRDQFQGTDQEWQDLQDLYATRDQQAADKLLARRLRDVVWTRNVLQRFAGRVSKRAKEARARISAEVEQELQAQPVYRAMRFFRRGEAVADDGTVSKFDGNHRLDLDAVRRILPDEDIDSISRGRYRAVAKKGLNPDVVANNFGYQDGETMVRELLAAPPLQEAVDAETQRRMASKHAELATPEAIQRQAAVELRSEAHARIVATELRSAAKSTQPVGVMTQAAKIAAEQAIGTMAARDVKASKFERDERRFADMAVKAMMPSVKKGQQPRKTVDDNAVTSAKRQQLLAVQMARVARAFEKELRGYRRLINRLRRTSIREQVGDRGGDVITQLLSNINLETGQPAAVVPRQVSPTDAAAWIQEKAAEGWPLNVDIAWMQSFRGTDYRDMTVADLREFMRMLQEVAHAAKQSHSEQLLLATQTVREVRNECREAAKLNANGDFSNQRLDPTWMSGAKNLGYKAEASLITAMTKMRVMDGGKLGPWFTHIWDKASALADKKDQMIYELGERMNAITEPLRKSKFWKQKFSVPELNLGPKQLTGEELFTLLLNMGNEGNINRLLSGAQQHGWTYNTLTSAVSKLPTEAIEAAQKIWDAIAVYKPEVARLERKTKGREPNWVEPRLLNVVSSSGKRLLLRGGYYPIVYDTTRSTKSQARSEQQEADLLTRRAQARTTTTQTYTKDRVEEVDPGQFVALTLDGLFSHLEMVVHDIVWREFVIDTNRILKGGGGNSLLQDVSNSYGAAWASDLKAWLDRIADNGYKKRSDLDKLAAVVRRNVSVGALAGNIYTVVKQYGGVFYSIPRSGIVNTTHAIGEYLMNPRATHRWMLQNSPDFKLRYITRYRTSWENLLDVRNKNPKLRWLNAKLFSLIQFAQSTPDAISYLAAYKKSMLDGSTDQEAHREAYQAVAETQSSARPIDFSTLEAEASDAALTLIPFYRIANANLNLFYGSSLKNKDKQGMFGAKKALDFMIIMGVGAYMAEVFAASVKALISSGDEEQEEEEDWAWATGKEFAATTLKTTMQSIPIVNQLANVADVMFDQDFIPWRGPMGMKGIGDAESFFLQMRQAVKDDDWDKALVKSSISTLGLFYPIPTVLMRRMADTVDAYMDGDEDVNPFMILTGTDR